MKNVSRGFRLVTTVLEMHQSGRVSDDVIDAMLEGLTFHTTTGVGTWEDGMLVTPAGKVSFSLTKLTKVCVTAVKKPVVQEVVIKKTASTGTTEAASKKLGDLLK